MHSLRLCCVFRQKRSSFFVPALSVRSPAAQYPQHIRPCHISCIVPPFGGQALRGRPPFRGGKIAMHPCRPQGLLLIAPHSEYAVSMPHHRIYAEKRKPPKPPPAAVCSCGFSPGSNTGIEFLRRDTCQSPPDTASHKVCFAEYLDLAVFRPENGRITTFSLKILPQIG